MIWIRRSFCSKKVRQGQTILTQRRFAQTILLQSTTDSFNRETAIDEKCIRIQWEVLTVESNKRLKNNKTNENWKNGQEKFLSSRANKSIPNEPILRRLESTGKMDSQKKGIQQIKGRRMFRATQVESTLFQDSSIKTIPCVVFLVSCIRLSFPPLHLQ